MASFKIQIVDGKQNISFNARYERMDKESNTKIKVVAKSNDGKEVSEKTFYQDQLLPQGSTCRKWVDDEGRVYAKSELSFWYGDTVVSEVEQTKVFNIESYQSLKNYTDKYCISAYYEVFPDDNGMTKDIDKMIAVNSNLRSMRKLWEFLMSSGTVARGVFCPTSRGFVESDGYIRAIEIDQNKWGLEIGQFKQEKVFNHLNEGVPDEVKAPVETSKVKIRKI